MKKNQLGYTVIELVIALAALSVIVIGCMLLVAAVYAIGHILLGWW